MFRILSQCPIFPESFGDHHKSEMNIAGFGNDLAPTSEGMFVSFSPIFSLLFLVWFQEIK